jgi:hypothetical protein
MIFYGGLHPEVRMVFVQPRTPIPCAPKQPLFADLIGYYRVSTTSRARADSASMPSRNAHVARAMPGSYQPRLWAQLADEARNAAKQIKDPDAKLRMLVAAWLGKAEKGAASLRRRPAYRRFPNRPVLLCSSPLWQHAFGRATQR